MCCLIIGSIMNAKHVYNFRLLESCDQRNGAQERGKDVIWANCAKYLSLDPWHMKSYTTNALISSIGSRGKFLCLDGIVRFCWAVEHFDVLSPHHSTVFVTFRQCCPQYIQVNKGYRCPIHHLGRSWVHERPWRNHRIVFHMLSLNFPSPLDRKSLISAAYKRAKETGWVGDTCSILGNFIQSSANNDGTKVRWYLQDLTRCM